LGLPQPNPNFIMDLMEKTKIAFFGSSKYSLPFLEQLSQSSNLEIVLVVSQPDKPGGRGFETKPTPVKLWAKEHKILTLTPSDLAESLFLGTLKSLPLNLGLSVYYGLKIPQTVIEFFPLGIYNIHHSLLPKYKGANPIPWAIINGEEKTGTTIIKIDEKFDRGQIAAQAEEKIRGDDTTESLRQRLDEKALNLLRENLSDILNNRLTLRNQEGEGNYVAKITKEMGQIDWSKSPVEIERLIRALTPWPGAWSTLGEILERYKDTRILRNHHPERRVRILEAHLEESRLVIDLLQIEGKNSISWREFENGYLK